MSIVGVSRPDRRIPFSDLRAEYLESRALYDAAYSRVMESGRWILGAELASFETEFARLCGSSHCIGVANGLDALYLTLKGLNIGPGDEVIVPSHTFVATWLAVVRAGAVPVAVEPLPDAFNICATEIEKKLTSKTKAIMPVHLYGSIAEVREIAELCRVTKIHLIEDAAQAHGARLDTRHAGAFGTAGCFSFYPSKNLGAFGDGGAILTSDASLAVKLRALRNYGSESRYVHNDAGINSRLDELQAAWLKVKLGKLLDHNLRRSAIAAIYDAELSGIEELRVPAPGVPGSHVWHLYVVRMRQRDRLQKHLAKLGCETLIHYPRPVYRYPPFAEFAPTGETPSDRLTKEVLSLPIGPHLAHEDVRLVCTQIREFFAETAA